MRHFIEEARLVLDVPQVPKLHCVIDRGRRQQPVTSGVELCMRHFGFVQLVTENLRERQKQKINIYVFRVLKNSNLYIFYITKNLLL